MIENQTSLLRSDKWKRLVENVNVSSLIFVYCDILHVENILKRHQKQ